jgi:hypothetical protein
MDFPIALPRNFWAWGHLFRWALSGGFDDQYAADVQLDLWGSPLRSLVDVT